MHRKDGKMVCGGKQQIGVSAL